MAVDLDLLAYDISDMLDKFEHDLGADYGLSDVRKALPAFLDAVRTNALQHTPEPGEDAATWTAEPEPTPEPATYQPPKYGRVRCYPWYQFALTDPANPDADEIWIVDYDKAGEDAARQQAIELAGPGAIVGRLLRKETFRWRPYAGTPKDARP